MENQRDWFEIDSYLVAGGSSTGSELLKSASVLFNVYSILVYILIIWGSWSACTIREYWIDSLNYQKQSKSRR